ncbi:MAG: hydroxymethylbilane synthase, partial [Clostridia bacterium]|nr:hydroxymethylbilane synthase [Clostridia bacterium]
PDVDVEPVLLSTRGDREKERPLSEIGGKGLFVRDLEEALLNGLIDVAVHSAKDLPAVTPDGLEIAAVSAREDPADLLLTRKGEPTPYPFVVGTSSPRRALALSAMFPGCTTTPLRGNITTRLQKLIDGELDAILLAAAGVRRLSPDLTGIRIQKLDPNLFLPAPCQGILAYETLAGSETAQWLHALDHTQTHAVFTVEKRLLQLLGADCHDAVGIYGESLDEDTFRVSAFYETFRVLRKEVPKADPEPALSELVALLKAGRI